MKKPTRNEALEEVARRFVNKHNKRHNPKAGHIDPPSEEIRLLGGDELVKLLAKAA